MLIALPQSIFAFYLHIYIFLSKSISIILLVYTYMCVKLCKCASNYCLYFLFFPPTPQHKTSFTSSLNTWLTAIHSSQMGSKKNIDQYSFDIFSLFFRVASSFLPWRNTLKKVVFVLTNLFPRIFLFPSFRVITSLIYIFSYESSASTTWTQQKFFR